jgi:hypothetical protein
MRNKRSVARGCHGMAGPVSIATRAVFVWASAHRHEVQVLRSVSRVRLELGSRNTRERDALAVIYFGSIERTRLRTS